MAGAKKSTAKSTAKKTIAKKTTTKKAVAKKTVKAPAKKAVAKKPAAKSIGAKKPVALPKARPTYQEIADLAHRYWRERGGHHGSDREDWARAERELHAS